MKRLVFLLCAGLTGGMAFGAAQPFVNLPSPTYAGLVRDYLYEPYDGTNAVGILVRRATDGKLLASAVTGDAARGINYSVSVPMVNVPSENVLGLTYGAKATFSFVTSDVIWSDFATVTVDRPGYVRQDFTLCHDANANGVADEYEALIAIRMAEYGIAGAYDADADYNQDGVKNRDHYLAGTNPFAGLIVGGGKIGEEHCTIASMMNVRSTAGEDFFAITFNAAEEWVYSVVALDNLSAGWGSAVTVDTRETADGDAYAEHFADAPGEMTLYVPKGDAKQRFFKLVVGSW